MHFKDIDFYLEFWMDAIIYAVMFVVVIILARVWWEIKEGRRLKKVFADYMRSRKDAEEEE